MVREVRAVAKGPRGEAALTHLEKAASAMEHGRPGKAIPDAEQAKQLAPRAAVVREALALALYGAGNYQAAVTEFQAYRRLSGRKDQSHVEADALRALGQPDKALALINEELADRSVHAEARAEAAVVGGSLLADQERYDAALALLRRFKTDAQSGRPWDLRVWYVTGDILLRQGKRAEAAEEFRRVVRFDPEAFDASERLVGLAD